ncbi:hypothetical protein [Streptomyces sp. NPDC058486]|uniref:hypothetical protein n=1 Tax=unclassified Streptomyces TaxID=2593676 RepID=UPI003664E545
MQGECAIASGASKKNGKLPGIVAATGGGGYRADFGWAELDPGFAKSRVLLAVSEDDKPFEAAEVSELNQLWVGTVDTLVDADSEPARAGS